jgi:nucleotide-binding universal stress UspA family protein
MFTHILVPLDGSSIAECVLPHAAKAAQACGARITLLHVLEHKQSQRDNRPVDPLDWEMKRSEAEAYLATVEERLRRLDIVVEPVVVEGNAAEAVVAFAHKNDVDLLVISSHGESGFTGWNVSSTVQKVVLRAYVSILIVRAYEAPAVTLPDFSYGRIVVPLDGSQRAEWVLSCVQKLAAFEDAAVELVHVLAPPEMPRQAPPSQEDAELARRLLDRNRQEMESYLESLSVRLNHDVKVRLLSGKEVVTTLHQFVEEEEGAGLLVLNAHGYSENTRWPYGAVPTSFIFYGTTPLLIVQDLSVEKVKPTRAELVAREQKGH